MAWRYVLLLVGVAAVVAGSQLEHSERWVRVRHRDWWISDVGAVIAAFGAVLILAGVWWVIILGAIDLAGWLS